MSRSTQFACLVLAMLAAVVAAALGLGRWLVLVPDEGTRLRDDAYYEFAWAANVAAGRGPTVSDGVTTSGVQLGWTLLLVPFAWAFGPAALPLVAAWLGFAVHALTALIWWRVSRDRRTGLCLALAWLGHPLLLREAQNGQETALATLLALALWLGRASSRARFTALAVAAVLVRSDLFGVVLLLSLWRDWRRPARAAVAPLLALAVHIASNLMLGAGPLPDSALPMAWIVSFGCTSGSPRSPHQPATP